MVLGGWHDNHLYGIIYHGFIHKKSVFSDENRFASTLIIWRDKGQPVKIYHISMENTI